MSEVDATGSVSLAVLDVSLKTRLPRLRLAGARKRWLC